MSLRQWLARRSVTDLVRLSCVLALVALAMMVASVLSGRPLPIILAMSLGHLLGISSLACFLLGVLLDGLRRE
jgi:hypothetical protein